MSEESPGILTKRGLQSMTSPILSVTSVCSFMLHGARSPVHPCIGTLGLQPPHSPLGSRGQNLQPGASGASVLPAL